MHVKEILRKIQGRGCLRSADGEERRKRAIYYRRLKTCEKRENMNTKKHYVPVAEEGKSPHRQLYK